jgi:hypothetical protein
MDLSVLLENYSADDAYVYTPLGIACCSLRCLESPRLVSVSSLSLSIKCPFLSFNSKASLDVLFVFFKFFLCIVREVNSKQGDCILVTTTYIYFKRFECAYR